TREATVLLAGMGRLLYQWNDLAAARTFFNAGLDRRHSPYSMGCHIELLRLKLARHEEEGMPLLLQQLETYAQQTGLAWTQSVIMAVKIRLRQVGAVVASGWADAYE